MPLSSASSVDGATIGSSVDGMSYCRISFARLTCAIVPQHVLDDRRLRRPVSSPVCPADAASAGWPSTGHDGHVARVGRTARFRPRSIVSASLKSLKTKKLEARRTDTARVSRAVGRPERRQMSHVEGKARRGKRRRASSARKWAGEGERWAGGRKVGRRAEDGQERTRKPKTVIQSGGR